MKRVWLQFKNVKTEIKLLNIREFSNVGNRIRSIRRKLADLQEQMRDYRHDGVLFEQERTLMKELEK